MNSGRLALVGAAACATVYFVFPRADRSPSPNPVPLPPQPREIRIAYMDGAVRLVHRSEGWWIAEPVKERADAARVDRLIKNLRLLTLDRLVTDDVGALDSFDLGTRGVKIAVIGDRGDAAEWTIGKDDVVKGRIFARTSIAPGVYLVQGLSRQDLGHVWNFWMDRRLIVIEPENPVVQITRRSPYGNEGYRRVEGTWRSDRGTVESSKIDGWLTSLGALHHNGYYEDSIPRTTQSLVLRYGNGETVTLTALRLAPWERAVGAVERVGLTGHLRVSLDALATLFPSPQSFRPDDRRFSKYPRSADAVRSEARPSP